MAGRVAVTDYFELLDEPRRPWLDPTSLNKKFLALSSQSHPDRFHNSSESEQQTAGRRFAELNSAYQCLREPELRLRHLLELELGARPPSIQPVPPGLMETFVEVGTLCRQTDAFLEERSKVTSPILKAGMFERGEEWTDKLKAVQQKINFRRDEILTELRNLNSAWESAVDAAPTHHELPLARLEEISRLLGYFARWSEQLQARIVQLSL